MNTNTFKHIRTARGLTMKELAQKLGVSTRTVWTWEAGEKRPNDANLQKVIDLAPNYFDARVELVECLTRRSYSLREAWAAAMKADEELLLWQTELDESIEKALRECPSMSMRRSRRKTKEVLKSVKK